MTNPSETKRPSVLVVDDEVGFRTLLTWELSSRGMDVESAQDGIEAAKLAKTRKFDLVITDLTMPHADGLVLLEELKRSLPATQVIITTGFGTVEVAVYAMQQGAFDFILKPFDLEGLMRRIEDALKNISKVCTCHIHHREKGTQCQN